MGKELLWSVVSFFGSLAVWAVMQGNWVAATILMVVILIHEMGHYIAGLMLGAKVKLPVFIVIGAFVQYEASATTRQRDRFIISLAGPFLGAVAAGVMWIAGLYLGNVVLLKAAAFGLLLNAFQLIPVPMLDGGHAVLPIDRRLWKVGIGMIFAWAAYQIFSFGNYSPALFIVLFWDSVAGYMRAVEAQIAENPDSFAVTPSERTGFAVAYFGLSAVLLVAMYSLGMII